MGLITERKDVVDEFRGEGIKGNEHGREFIQGVWNRVGDKGDERCHKAYKGDWAMRYREGRGTER